MNSNLKHRVNLTKLKSGAKIVHVQIPNYPISISSVWINVGSRNDPTNKDGLAHFCEHLLFTKTKKFPDRVARLLEIEKRGFSFNAFTSLDTTNYYYIHSPEKRLYAVNLLIDGLTSSTFTKQDVENEKQIILNEEKRNRDDPSSYIWRLANQGIWPGSKIGRSLYGNSSSIEKISQNDITKFYQSFYTSPCMTFVFINSFPNIEIESKAISKSIKAGRKVSNMLDNFVKHPNQIIFEEKNIEDYQVALSFLTTHGTNYKDTLVLDLIGKYLANGWISILINKLRIENNLTYWTSLDMQSYQDTGYMRFTLSVNKENFTRVLEIFEQEIIKIKINKLSPSELKPHKTKYKSDLLQSSLDPYFLLWWYGHDISAFGATPISINQYIEDMLAIGSKDILEVANKYLKKENFSIAIVGKEKLTSEVPTFQEQ